MRSLLICIDKNIFSHLTLHIIYMYKQYRSSILILIHMNKFTCVSCADKQRICVFTPENITETQLKYI